MKTALALLILLSVTLGLQQAQAQSVMSYEEWRNSSAKGKKAAAKSAKSGKGSTKEKAAVPAALAPPLGTFTGTVPCADCKGISTELVLNGAANGSSRTFTMKQTYIGKPADKNMVLSSGIWILAKGNKQDPEALILQLIPTKGDIDPMYFLQVSDKEVKLLDRQQAVIKSPHNYSLKKQ